MMVAASATVVPGSTVTSSLVMTSRIVAIPLSSKRSGATSLAEPLMKWFEPRRHAYPWRGTSDPYAVLVSEAMLQQTQAARVVPAFERFLRRFPTVVTLARASRADVVRVWEGLGYNRRPVALSEAARAIVRDHGGRGPAEPEELEGPPRGRP